MHFNFSLHYVKATQGMWMYGLFEVLEFPIRDVVMGCLILPALIFLFVGKKIHKLAWSK